MNTPDQLPFNEKSKVIPVIEEKLHVSKEWKETGRVRISKTVAEEEVDYQVPIQQEELVVERKQINKYVDVAPPATRYEGDTTIISVMKEVIVVEKKLMLVEELHITKRKTEHIVTGTETLRQEQVTIDKIDLNQPEKQ